MKLSSVQLTSLLLAICTFIWGSAFIAAKIAMESLHPVTVAFLRFLGASILLWIAMMLREPIRPKLQRKDYYVFTILGLIGIFGYNVLFFYGVNLATVTKSSLLIATNPIFIAIFSVIFLKEHVTMLQFSGIALGILGAIVIITEGSIEQFILLGISKVDLILFGAVICWAIYSVVGKVSLQRFSPLVSTTYACIAGTICLFPLALYTFKMEHLELATFGTWISILYMAIFVSGISFVIWYDGIKKVGAARAASFINLMPISAVVLASIVFGERISSIQFFGATMILFGVYLSNRKTAPIAQEKAESKESKESKGGETFCLPDKT